MSTPHTLITGATGLVGRALTEHFSNLPSHPTTSLSRRPPFHPSTTWHPCDLTSPPSIIAALSAIPPSQPPITHLVFAALHEEPSLAAGWLQQTHVDRNALMLQNTVEAVAKVSGALERVTILQGPKAYGVHVGAVRPGSREDRDEERGVVNFYWAQQDWLAEFCELEGRRRGRELCYTVLRPALVIGEAVGGAMNLLAVLGVYAAILRGRGERLHYPGGGEGMVEATDTDLMARCCEWIGKGRVVGGDRKEVPMGNQTYNLTNGEFFSMRHEWAFIAQCFGMEVGEDRDITFAEAIQTQEWKDEWDSIRKDHGLISPGIEEFLGQSGQFADFIFGRTAGTSSAMSCIKVRRAGFDEYMYSDDMLSKWFKRYQDDKLLPQFTTGTGQTKSCI
ncbi:NAD(P)-binding protein [Eremomyces bilateralis CBS 781.70]|uniref:NAD(P)-binding protein n=1 Tax=Eremomyces bilateralis CBS 781.70 TaxID=1392243 RepID=A0A6G1FXW3_9PEZI|nr:NAD(P)-binding protein [Eremomyces bilateralis CBS 781.70]KAF1810530.1 NAD(P)-binding protein [Eremomyces bilateralis CBS 781.70]